MTVLTMPDGTSVEVPDNPSPEVLAGLKQVYENSKPSGLSKGSTQANETLKEVGRVAGKSVQSGLAGLPGLVGDVGLTGIRAATGEQSVLGKVPQFLPGGLGLAATALSKARGGIVDAIQGTKFGDVTDTIKTLGGVLPKIEPKTAIGKSAGNIGEAVVGAMAGGGPVGMAGNAGIGLGSGIGGEIGSRAMSSSPGADDSTLGRILGAILGGGATAIGTSMAKNSTDMMKSATKQVTDSEWRRAAVKEATLEANGIPHLKSQLLGDNSTMPDLVAQAATFPNVRPDLIKAVKGSKDQAFTAVENFMKKTLPIATESRPSILNDVQGTAEKVIEEIHKKAGKAYTDAVPAGLDKSRYTPPYVKAMRDELLALTRSPGIGTSSERGKALLKFANEKLVDPETGRLITSKGQLNTLYKDVNQLGVDNGYAGLNVGDIRKIMSSYTQEYQPARDAFRNILKNDLEPMEKSLVGKLAQQGGGQRPDKFTAAKQSLDIMFPKDMNQAAEITQAGKALGPDAMGQMLQQDISRKLQMAVQEKAAVGESTQTPYKFFQAMAGTKAQQANLDAAIIASVDPKLANPQAVKVGFYKLLRALETTRDIQIPAAIDKAQLSQQSGSNLAGNVSTPLSSIRRWSWANASEKTYREIAAVAMSPDGLKILQAIAKSPDPKRAQAFAASIITQAESKQAED